MTKICDNEYFHDSKTLQKITEDKMNKCNLPDKDDSPWIDVTYDGFNEEALQEHMDDEKKQKRNDALGLIIESVLQPDHKLRQCAHNQKCYNELMEWREEALVYLNQRRKDEFDV